MHNEAHTLFMLSLFSDKLYKCCYGKVWAAIWGGLLSPVKEFGLCFRMETVLVKSYLSLMALVFTAYWWRQIWERAKQKKGGNHILSYQSYGQKLHLTEEQYAQSIPKKLCNWSSPTAYRKSTSVNKSRPTDDASWTPIYAGISVGTSNWEET